MWMKDGLNQSDISYNLEKTKTMKGEDMVHLEMYINNGKFFYTGVDIPSLSNKWVDLTDVQEGKV